MSASFSSAIAKFAQWLQDSNTHPSIYSCFVATLSSHEVLSFHPSADPITIAAAQKQDLIGWENFLLGQLSLQWSHIQEQHFWQLNS